MAKKYQKGHIFYEYNWNQWVCVGCGPKYISCTNIQYPNRKPTRFHIDDLREDTQYGIGIKLYESLDILNKQKEKDPSNRLVYFDCDTFHTGTKAVKNGWRWFGRVSRNTDRVNKITNEIRKQAQVYLEFPMEGW